MFHWQNQIKQNDGNSHRILSTVQQPIKHTYWSFKGHLSSFGPKLGDTLAQKIPIKLLGIKIPAPTTPTQLRCFWSRCTSQTALGRHWHVGGKFPTPQSAVPPAPRMMWRSAWQGPQHAVCQGGTFLALILHGVNLTLFVSLCAFQTGSA